jgi:DNA-directed RNA polymerase specialized sigma24 family protein
MAQEEGDSVTFWLERLKSGDRAAVQRLWERYFDRLVRLARRRLERGARRVADEEDAALSAFHSFCQRVEGERFPQLEDRTDLWRLLVVITSRKALKQAQANRRAKRGGGTVRGDSVFVGAGEEQAGIQAIADEQPTPEFAVQMAEEVRTLLARLDDPSLSELALLKLEGYSNEEIATRLKCALRTVERRLRGIRAIWSQSDSDGHESPSHALPRP